MKEKVPNIGLLFSNPADRSLLIKFLSNEGYSIYAPSGSEFHTKYLEEVDLIIVDESFGRKHSQALLSHKSSSGVFFPLLITLPQKRDHLPWLRSGFDDVLRMPMTKAELMARLNVFLRLLEMSKEQYRSLVEDSVIGFYRTTLDGRILMANPALVRMLRFSSFEELAQRNLEQYGFTAEYPRSVFKERMEKQGQIVGLEMVWLRKDGTELYIRENARCIKDKSGKILYYEGTVEDITDRKRAEEERERLQHQLIQSEKMAAIGTLASGIGHEFNNLLQIMRGHAEFAQRTKRAKDMEDAVEIILDSSDKASKIIGDLLTFSREESPNKEISNITKQVEAVLLLVEEQLRKRNIKVVRIYEKTPEVKINKGEIQQVFLNIINNARDAMLPKGGKLEIRIKRLKKNVEISFTDTGIGIEEENLSKVFEPFYTTKGAVGSDSKIQGVGLGLAVSYGIVKRHEGTIEMESEVGKGTTFTVKLLVKGVEDKEVRIEYRKKRKRKKPEHLKILVVDDEEDICKMFRKWLSSEGHRVKSADTGMKAMNLVKRECFDVVFLDIVMPGIPSVEVLERVKEISPNTKVIIITGSLMKEELWDELRNKGASGFIQKPFMLEDINKCLAK